MFPRSGDGESAGFRVGFVERSGLSLDGYQVAALDVLDDGDSVLVAAPTGSGKTLVAEYAIERAVSRGARAFYTAPMKALSNQKFNDLRRRHGAAAVGLLTGDNSINPEADIVVMTTEVLRNMLYVTSSRLDDLGVVILDEVHFLQDAYRGPTWEEVIIHLDPTVQLVCLSATVSNASDIADWLSTVRGRTTPVVEVRRPVELVNHVVIGDSATGRVEMHDLLVSGAPNAALRRKLASGADRFAGRSRRGPRTRFHTPSRPDVVDLLVTKGLVPAIVFIFSRAQCEDAVSSCRRAGMQLTSVEERHRIDEIIAERLGDLPEDDRRALDFESFAEDCRNGIAAHHAGMIPMYRETVERCFVEGLIKVVFATETLAVGINMPAKAVVIERLSKYTGEHHESLKASEYTQLTGRAGRRGLDSIGHALVLWNPFASFDQMVALSQSRSFELMSAFRPTFNMAVNLIRSHSRAATHHLLNLSLAQYQADREVVGVEARLEQKRRELARLSVDGQDVSDSSEPSSELRQDEVDSESVLASDAEVTIALRSLRPGDVSLFDTHVVRGKVLVISVADRKSGPRITVVSPSRRVFTLVASDFVRLPRRCGIVGLPVPYEPARSEFVREASRRLVRAKATLEEGPRIVRNGRHRPDDGDSLQRKRRRLQREIEQLSVRQRARSGAVVGKFEDVVGVLETLHYVDDWTLTEKGQTLSKIFHESDLLVVEMMQGSLLTGLGRAEFSALLSAVVFERRGGDESLPRWPSDELRKRFRRLEKLAQRLADTQRAAGMTPLRTPDAGLVWETFCWSSGRPLSEVLDPALTPGDFVRNMRQLIDLVRQVRESTTDVEVRELCTDVERSLDRGVVAASVGGVFDAD